MISLRSLRKEKYPLWTPPKRKKDLENLSEPVLPTRNAAPSKSYGLNAHRHGKVVKETEAEAIAFVIAKAVSLETGSASADYIHLYHGNASLLAESLEVIQQTSAVILAALESSATEGTMPDAELARVA